MLFSVPADRYCRQLLSKTPLHICVYAMNSVKDLHFAVLSIIANREHERKGQSEVFKFAQNPLVQDSDVNNSQRRII